MSNRTEHTFDPASLSMAQRSGAACVVCAKAWPRPRVRVGVLAAAGGGLFDVDAGAAVYACDECADLIGPAG